MRVFYRHDIDSHYFDSRVIDDVSGAVRCDVWRFRGQYGESRPAGALPRPVFRLMQNRDGDGELAWTFPDDYITRLRARLEQIYPELEDLNTK